MPICPVCNFRILSTEGHPRECATLAAVVNILVTPGTCRICGDTTPASSRVCLGCHAAMQLETRPSWALETLRALAVERASGRRN
jgi:hypothetical protein